MATTFLRPLSLALALALLPLASPGGEPAFTPPPITVPDGFSIELVAAPPLVGHPMMACFDERGRLFVAESAGLNMNNEELEKARPNFIRLLEDTNGDGKFDKSTIFADNLMIPNGALWLDGALYVAEPPGIWRMEDTNGDGVADRRTHIAGKVRSNGMSSTLHGPVLGPTGRLFWCSGQMGYNLDKNGELPAGRIAPGVFTLRPDGTEHEVFSVGGLANPVEVTFSPEGEVFGTVAILDYPDGARHDGLMHWVYGGVYNISANDPCPVKRTGDFLPPLSHVGQVAPAGVMRYRGSQFGHSYRDNIFWAQFNTHKVIRTQIERDGATFRSKDEDFLISESVDFHATDVLEDADGSLLVIDTGGWFRHGCPTSQIAKPEVQGAIYRIRRNGAPVIADPRGLKIDWQHATPAQLTALLGDSRPAVEDRAIATLAKMSDRAVDELQKTLRGKSSIQVQRNTVWTLARIDTKKSQAVLRAALDSRDPSVRQSAVYAMGLARDQKALVPLMKLVVQDPQPSLRREAATALGRIGQPRAVSPLLEALSGQKDRFLQHSLIYALIQINQPALTAKGLTSADPLTRRGALLALNQMDNTQLARDQVIPLLRSDDLELQKAAFSVAAKNSDWRADLVAVLRDWLGEEKLTDERAAFLRESILAQAADPLVQQLVADTLAHKETSTPMRLLLLDAIKRPSLKDYPLVWFAALEQEVQHGELETRLQAVSVFQERTIKRFDALLKQLALDANQPAPLRIAVIATLAPRLSPVDSQLFELVHGSLKTETVPLARLTAARTLAALQLSDDQLLAVAAMLGQVDALVLPTLLRSFSHSTNDAPGLALITALDNAPAAANLSADELARLTKAYSPAVQTAVKPLLKKLGVDLEKQQAHLEELSPLITGGDLSRGKAVFFGKKATCATCHRISGQGGLVGPSLGQIGKIRTGRDLLESIIYPSASIVQGFRPYTVETADDQTYSGIMLRQTPEAIWIRGTDLAEIKIDTKQIKSMQESAISIMPQGLGDALTRDELRDLLAYLQSLK
jgi:putative membrane-bound dehydrogenase-like protein